MSSRAAEPRPAGRQAGFMLLEVLVAIVIAGLVLGAVGQALAGGWRNARIPSDVLSAATLARAGLAGVMGEDRAPGYAIGRRVRPATLLIRPSPVAPAPRVTAPVVAGARGPKANDVMPGVTRNAAPVGETGSGVLQRVAVTVRTPSGRQVTVETVRLDVPPR